jgi:hypothetical protein
MELLYLLFYLTYDTYLLNTIISKSIVIITWRGSLLKS